MRTGTVLGAAIAAATLLSGCSQPKLRPSFVNGTPEERTWAAAEAVRTNDASRVPQLISMLGSEDPAQRMIASDALERLTGQRLGYHYADPEPRRREAIARWRQWRRDADEVDSGSES